MRTFLLSCLAALLALLAPVTAAAQTSTACDSTGADPLFVLAPDAPGLNNYGFAYAPADHAQVTLYRLRIYDADMPTGPALSTQDVTRAATTFLGTSPASGLGCYQLPVVPVEQLPRGKRLTLTVQAVGALTELSARESGRSPDPFGAALRDTAAPQRKPGS